jgi:bacteriocin-like protein
MQDMTIAMETEMLAEEISSTLIRELSDEELAQVSGGGDANQ